MLLLFIPTFIQAQKNIETSNQQWFQYYNQVHFSEKFSLLSDIGFRMKEQFSHAAQHVIRTGVGYQLNKECRLVVGIGHFGSYSSERINKIEFRPYQELTLKQKLEKVGLTHRFRVEERYFKTIENGNIIAGTTFNFRFRYRFAIGIPIVSFSNIKISFQVADEILINAGRSIVYNMFDQNRILLGPEVQFNHQFSISLNYNYQYAALNKPAYYKSDHILWLGLMHKLTLKEAKKPESPLP